MKDVATFERIINNPIIAAVSSKEQLSNALKSSVEVVFILDSTIQTIKDMVDACHEAKKFVFVHVDLLKGLTSDDNGLAYLNTLAAPDGIISTKPHVLKRAKEHGFYVIQRVFIIDSKSIDLALKISREVKPNLIEVMPGLVTKVLKRMSDKTSIPLIAGGLVEEESEVMSLLKAGAVSISTSRDTLWQI